MSLALILFDLDGTLFDTAPDLGGALNAQRAEHRLEPLSPEQIRPQVSHGSPALLRLGFGIEPRDSRYAGMRARLLELYRDRLNQDTRYFPGMQSVLQTLERRNLRWGIVTNKPAVLTEPLIAAFKLDTRAACVVSGDTTARRKPYPDQLLHACELCQVQPVDALYVGDAQPDVLAAHAAGMRVLVALYGYIADGEHPQQWGADGLLAAPADLLTWLSAQTSARHGIPA